MPALVWGHYIIMAKQNTMTVAQRNAGWNAVCKETHTLNQTLKLFGGITSKKLPELEGLTIGQFLTQNGIAVNKGKVTVGAIKNAWNPGMIVDNQLAVFRNMPVLWTPKEGDGLWEKKTRAFRVCTKEQAENYIKTGEYTPLTVYTLLPVDDYRWSVEVIARAMKQGQDYETHNKKSVDSQLAYDEIDKLYIVYDIEIEKGRFERKMRQVSKADVEI